MKGGRRARLEIGEENVGIDDAEARRDPLVDVDVADDMNVVETLEERREAEPREAIGRGDGDAQSTRDCWLRIPGYEFEHWHSGYYAPALRVTETSLPGVLVVEPKIYTDERGFFLETWHLQRFLEMGIRENFVQDNHSRSQRGVLRGLHYQEPKQQGKLVRCSRGAIFDVAVDIRPGSPRFGSSVGLLLSAENFLQIWIPEGFAHGFCVISELAEIQYKCTAPYDPASEITIAWDDPRLAIQWPVHDPLLSPKDRLGRRLGDFSEAELPGYSRSPRSPG